jgi:hypothetical protein
MPAPTRGRGLRSCAGVREAIERFLSASREPVLIEPGESPYPLATNNYSLEVNKNTVTLQVWDERRFLARRILDLTLEKPGRLELLVAVFPNREGKLALVDRAHPAQRAVLARGGRLGFRERFRGILRRAYPDWDLAELSTGQDLEHSLSPLYPRALLRKGHAAVAAIATPPEGAPPEGALSFGLIWLDHLRRRETRRVVEGLTVFVPEGRSRRTCLRVRWLDARLARFEVQAYSEEDLSGRLDAADCGNLDTRLEPFRDAAALMSGEVHAWVERLGRAEGVEAVAASGGALSLRVRGLEFARAEGGRMRFGIEARRELTALDLAEAESLAESLARWRAPDPPDRTHPLYRRNPERWLESVVRRRLEEIDASLSPDVVYGQAPAVAGAERGVVDLLAADRSGRLAVIEVKATADIHLPLQALDYWLRVRWHLDRGEFERLGYFPGVALRREPPRMLLVAPALEFHPTTGAILRFFSPEVPVECIGLGVEWRRQPKVVFRRMGAERDSAGSADRCQSPS